MLFYCTKTLETGESERFWQIKNMVEEKKKKKNYTAIK